MNPLALGIIVVVLAACSAAISAVVITGSDQPDASAADQPAAPPVPNSRSPPASIAGAAPDGKPPHPPTTKFLPRPQPVPVRRHQHLAVGPATPGKLTPTDHDHVEQDQRKESNTHTSGATARPGHFRPEQVVAFSWNRWSLSLECSITLLALTTGLRACDIVGLRLVDIDWRTRTAGIVQQKTGNPLTVPLTDLVVDRLACYLLDDRPDSCDDHVFLRCKAPHVRLAGHASIHRVTAEVFRKAGVTDAKGGCRLLRHNAASRLLRASVPLATISAVLGHASPESTNSYLSVDSDRLLACVLEVPEAARS